MARVGHVIGNGDCAITSYKPAKGFKVTCNIPPMNVENAWGTCIVDFKMMNSINNGGVVIPGDWILGANFTLKELSLAMKLIIPLPNLVSLISCA